MLSSKISENCEESNHTMERYPEPQEAKDSEQIHNDIFSDSRNVSMTADSRDNSQFMESDKPFGYQLFNEQQEKIDPSVYIDEETRMFANESPGINSPHGLVSPVDRGEVSSPFSAMESDGMETGFDDANLSTPGEFNRPRGFFGASTPLEYTTTPGASSSAGEDDYEESSGSRKKRRKTRRDMQPSYAVPYGNPALNSYFIRIPSPPTGTEKKMLSFSPEPEVKPAATTLNSLDQENVPKPLVVQSENNGECKKSKLQSAESQGISGTSAGIRRRHFTHHRVSTSTMLESDPQLHRQYPPKMDEYELCILSQPETQHRARYLTEGSRGPVKDASQQGFPKVQLLGYKGEATLQVFVGTDTGKIKPHAFYQACRVTGRSTSQCEEREIEGTKVIEIPFKTDDQILSVDCVGILKLRNTDVEARIGIRNQKRNQSVRLIFRVCLSKLDPVDNKDHPIILQVASVRINCTQPLGQPEIVKKSIDKCTVEGGLEMFMIGKNFHRGTTVVFQDPVEADGSQWQAEGKVDKDTFHQTHMVVGVPPYHDESIMKPVNVQILVKYQGRSCEPHSFTYIPSQSQDSKEGLVGTQASKPSNEPSVTVESSDVSDKKQQSLANISEGNIQPDAVKNMLEGPIDKQFLFALFSKLVTSVDLPTKTETPASITEMFKTDNHGQINPNSNVPPNYSTTVSLHDTKEQVTNYQGGQQPPEKHMDTSSNPPPLIPQLQSTQSSVQQNQMHFPIETKPMDPNQCLVKSESPNNAFFFALTSGNAISSTTSVTYCLPSGSNTFSVSSTLAQTLPGQSTTTIQDPSFPSPLSQPDSISMGATYPVTNIPPLQNLETNNNGQIFSSNSQTIPKSDIYFNKNFSNSLPEQPTQNPPMQNLSNQYTANVEKFDTPRFSPYPLQNPPTYQNSGELSNQGAITQTFETQVTGALPSYSHTQTFETQVTGALPSYSITQTFETQVTGALPSYSCQQKNIYEPNSNIASSPPMQFMENPSAGTLQNTCIVDPVFQQVPYADKTQTIDPFQMVREGMENSDQQRNMPGLVPANSDFSTMKQVNPGGEGGVMQALPQTLQINNSQIPNSISTVSAPGFLNNSLLQMNSNVQTSTAFPRLTTMCSTASANTPTTTSMFSGQAFRKPPPGANMALEHSPTDLFAMDQLLQSIDGSESLAAITGEDVQQHLQ